MVNEEKGTRFNKYLADDMLSVKVGVKTGQALRNGENLSVALDEAVLAIGGPRELTFDNLTKFVLVDGPPIVAGLILGVTGADVEQIQYKPWVQSLFSVDGDGNPQSK